MNDTMDMIGVAVPRGGAALWHAWALETLGAAGAPVDWAAGCPPLVPMPWRALLGLERLASRPKADLFAGQDIPASSLDSARPDMLLLPPGIRAGEDLLAQLPFGALELEPVTPGAMKNGVLEGRLFWRRAGRGARLALGTATSVQGPFPLGWAGPHLAKAALMPARLLARMARALPGGASGENSGIPAGTVEALWDSLPMGEPAGPYAPGALQWAGFAASLAGYGLKRAWLDLFHRRQWYLAVRPGSGDPSRPGFASVPFAPVLPPKGTGWADPFLVERDGRTWLFIEEIPGGKKGVLSVMEVLPGNGGGRSFGPVRRVLEEPFHLSYPNVFEHQGSMYMVPETSQAGQVRLYRAEDFPGGWVLDRVLLDGVPATDATFLEHGGLWWLFVSVRPRGGSSWDELHLFSAPGRFGPYEPHPLNPVVSDVRCARPAGPVIRSGGRLLRPAQDSSGWYGRALAVMEITRLDRQGYAEVPAGRLSPELVPGSFCLHTLVADGGLEVVDGQRFVPLWR